MKNTASVDALERFFRRQCDGLWEHSSGISICTTDNPGWLIVLECKERLRVQDAMKETLRRRFGASVSIEDGKVSIFASSLRELFDATMTLVSDDHCNNSTPFADAAAIEADILQVGERVRVSDKCTQVALRGQYGFIANPPKELKEAEVWDKHVMWEVLGFKKSPRYWVVLDSIRRAAEPSVAGDHMEANLAADDLESTSNA